MAQKSYEAIDIIDIIDTGYDPWIQQTDFNMEVSIAMGVAPNGRSFYGTINLDR